jgi:ABC-2 type transport system permease protein
MKRLLRSAFVIGRRDFGATVFSKTFIFFLIGPLFPVLLGALFGGIGARVATQADQSRIAVVASSEDFARLEAAREQLSAALGGSAPAQLFRVPPSGDPVAQARELAGVARAAGRGGAHRRS